VIDILLPFYGDPDYLNQAVASVIAQDDPDWRLVIVDDAYPDATAAARWADHADSRIEYYRNPTNLGVIGNFRRCLSLVEHDVAVFFGGDDLMQPNYVTVIHRAVEQFPDASIIQPGVDVIDDKGNPVKTGLGDLVKKRALTPRSAVPVLLSGESLAVSLLRGDWLYWPSLAFRRSALQGRDFRDDLPVILDLALIIDMIGDGCSLLYDPKTCFRYRRHAASVSSATAVEGRRFVDEKRYFGLVADQMVARGWPKAARAARWHITSRLHALTLVPGALAQPGRHALPDLLKHAFSS